MAPWLKYGLWGIGGLGGLWLASRLFSREVVTEGEAYPVPLLTPSVSPGTVAGVSEFPADISSGSGLNLLDLLKFETDAEAAAAAKQQAADQTAAAAEAAAAATARQAKQEAGILKFLRGIWNDINKPRIAEGKNPLKVCVRAGGGIGIGKQCAVAKRPQWIFSGGILTPGRPAATSPAATPGL